MSAQRECQAIAIVRYGKDEASGGRSYVIRRRAYMEVAIPKPDGELGWYDGYVQSRTGYFRLWDRSCFENIVLRRLSPRVYKGIGHVGGKGCTVSVYLWPGQ